MKDTTIEEDLVWFKQYLGYQKVKGELPEILMKKLEDFIKKVGEKVRK